MVKVVGHLLDYVAGDLRTARPVEICDTVAVVDAFESGEVTSDFRD
jgi:hypothetical protein